jgi:flagellin
LTPEGESGADLTRRRKMATRITTNVGAMIASLNLNKSFASAQSSISKLSSGLRIYRAGDDPGGITIYNRLKSDEAAWNQAAQNANEGIAILQVADSGASQQAALLNSKSAGRAVCERNLNVRFKNCG